MTESTERSSIPLFTPQISVKAQSQEFRPGLPRGQQWPKHLDDLLLSQAH